MEEPKGIQTDDRPKAPPKTDEQKAADARLLASQPVKSHVTDDDSPEHIKKHNERILKEREERDKRNEAGHKVNMEAAAKAHGKDGPQTDPSLGLEDNHLTPTSIDPVTGAKTWN